jgi:hypothetical protein
MICFQNHDLFPFLSFLLRGGGKTDERFVRLQHRTRMRRQSISFEATVGPPFFCPLFFCSGRLAIIRPVQHFQSLLHAAWHGWTPTDLVFPFFVFIVGVAVPLAFEKRQVVISAICI